jgi:WhiB family transcriptional regulator, redox-sensing transcriptional regulator
VKPKHRPDVISLLAAILQGSPKLPGAPCASDPHLFDGDTQSDRAAAVELCHRCPALAPCSAWAETAPHNSFHGTVGGRWYEWAPTTVRGGR